MNKTLSQETIDLAKSLFDRIESEQPGLAKGWAIGNATPTTGALMGYDLKGPALTMYPVLTPLRNRIPRNGGGFGSAVAWKAVTGININNMPVGVGEGNRGAVISTSTEDRMAKYVTIGFDDFVTYEMDSAAMGFDDPKARATIGLLRSTMIAEEGILLGGNGGSGVLLGTPAAPTLSADTTGTGGNLVNATTYHVRVVALTLEGYMRSTLTGGVPMTLTKTNADDSQDVFGSGSSKISAGASQATGGGGATNRILASTPAIRGAVAYAWFFGTDATTNCHIKAITTINSVVINTVSAAVTPTSYPNLTGWGTTAAQFDSNNTDNSRNSLLHDGILYAGPFNASGGGYYKALNTGTAGTGTKLTTNSAGGITEIDEALLYFWDTWRTGPSEIMVSARELRDITKLVISSGGAPLFRFNLDQNVARQVADVTAVAGCVVGSYLNPYGLGSGNLIPVRIHPNLPPGTILFWTDELPYSVSDVPYLTEVKERRGYYAIPYPQRTRKYEYGVYSEQTFRTFAPFAFGAVTNIAPQ